MSARIAPAWHVAWSLAGKWLVFFSPEPGPHQLQDVTLPAHQEAEAHLIGAAPRLLAAAAEVVRAHDSYMETIQDQVAAGNMRADPLGAAIEQIRAAIATATPGERQ